MIVLVVRVVTLVAGVNIVADANGSNLGLLGGALLGLFVASLEWGED